MPLRASDSKGTQLLTREGWSHATCSLWRMRASAGEGRALRRGRRGCSLQARLGRWLQSARSRTRELQRGLRLAARTSATNTGGCREQQQGRKAIVGGPTRMTDARVNNEGVETIKFGANALHKRFVCVLKRRRYAARAEQGAGASASAETQVTLQARAALAWGRPVMSRVEGMPKEQTPSVNSQESFPLFCRSIRRTRSSSDEHPDASGCCCGCLCSTASGGVGRRRRRR